MKQFNLILLSADFFLALYKQRVPYTQFFFRVKSYKKLLYNTIFYLYKALSFVRNEGVAYNSHPVFNKPTHTFSNTPIVKLY